eukprot:TRINITY_DN3480_c0_g1_i7.p1 TRINITY_DN3480_c0_g1~~TRINITY_DN3480_c0_g1_i7.p1  ORF type:complete len:367 (-),score=49.58 TRINITY_DN3480_c0_g1_i7:190-1290(-)
MREKKAEIVEAMHRKLRERSHARRARARAGAGAGEGVRGGEGVVDFTERTKSESERERERAEKEREERRSAEFLRACTHAHPEEPPHTAQSSRSAALLDSLRSILSFTEEEQNTEKGGQCRDAVVMKCQKIRKKSIQKMQLVKSYHSVLLKQCQTVRCKSQRLMVRNVLTESMVLQPKSIAPHFELPEPATGLMVGIQDVKKADTKALLVMFICNHCPFVIHLKPAIVSLAEDYMPKGLAMVAITSNSIETHPQDGPVSMVKDVDQYGYQFPYLYDETQEVAKAYKAACTPEFFLFDKELLLAYHGQYDDSRPRSDTPISGQDLKTAIDLVLEGKEVPPPWKPSIGCNIKWQPGKEPEWYGTQQIK